MRNQFIIEMGGRKSIGFPLFMSETPAQLDRGAPAVGEHSAALLRELLGMAENEIAALVREGVIA
jgi:crotonobetainyl-CoA:carnitine CoA-transferase CaiB-like acyl-CoA transferase